MTTLSRKERDRQLRRSDILKAAEHLFALKGYHNATIRDIAKEAQYATGTVYLHFKDKDALYFGLFEEKLKSLLSIVEGKAGQSEDSIGKLRIFVQESLVFFEKNQDFFKIFIAEEARLLIETRFLKSPTGQQLHEYTTKLIKQAQEEHIISRDFDPKQVNTVFVAILKTIVLEWFKEEKVQGKSLVDLSDIIFRYLLNGISNK
ncbi:MAG: TetR/AcrR family transcriptional regulator [Candidatus Omnitrophica bacterium]|nr:TetR/AcrR family transcriptional regulator [Candidatus Omnitrophota bacterium]